MDEGFRSTPLCDFPRDILHELGADEDAFPPGSPSFSKAKSAELVKIFPPPLVRHSSAPAEFQDGEAALHPKWTVAQLKSRAIKRIRGEGSPSLVPSPELAASELVVSKLDDALDVSRDEKLVLIRMDVSPSAQESKSKRFRTRVRVHSLIMGLQLL